jgi:photosynthetic reaction center cytochrome c subunit
MTQHTSKIPQTALTRQSIWRISGRARAAILTSTLIILGLSSDRTGVAQTPTQPPQPTQPAEQVFKNIQVLKGMPAADLQGAMSFIASSLGVDCDYCHRQDNEGTFASDTVPAKLRAREMIRMTSNINREGFHGENRVTCFTCHQGGTAPVSMATALLSSAPRPVDTPAKAAANAQGEPLPRVQQVLDHYVQALGGQVALDAVKTRIMNIAPLSRPSSDNSIDELFQKAPGKVLIFRQSQGYTFWAGFNGQRAWGQDSLKSYWGLLNNSELHSVMRDSEMYQGSRLATQYTNVIVASKEEINNRATYVISGTSPEGVREKFNFDVRTGLLLRRHIEEPTAFGWFPLDINFEGYREVDGVKIPFVVRLSSAGGAWGVRTSYMVLEVHQNIPIDDEKFDHPSPLK